MEIHNQQSNAVNILFYYRKQNERRRLITTKGRKKAWKR